jgi:hypothetical protein
MAPSPRATRLLGIAAIVATIGLLVVGVVAGQPTPQAATEDTTALAAAAIPEGSTTVTVHAHDDAAPAAPGTPTTAHAGHDEVAAGTTNASGSASAGDHGAAHGAGHTTTTAIVNGVVVTTPPHAGHDAVAASPGVPAPAHGHEGHTEVPATTVPGTPATTPTTGHDHGTPATTVPPVTVPGQTTTTTLPTGPIISVNDPRLTAEQRAAAVDLIARTKAGMRAFPDEAAVQRAGYVSIGDGVTGFEHYVNVAYLTDSHEVDPQHIESIVLRVSGGTKTVESAMYILTSGKTMDDVPDIAGELTTWHDHQNLCWIGTRVVGITDANGHCALGEFRPTAPMLHVWLTEQPCGPFAGIEGHGTNGCHAH